MNKIILPMPISVNTDVKIYNIKAVPKPRMTRSDKWKKRPCVVRYWQFKDTVKKLKIKVPESGSHIIFVIEMPKSWSKKKRKEMDRTPHKNRPDKDNLEKALLDAIYKEDSQIWDSRVTKIWGEKGQIIIAI